MSYYTGTLTLDGHEGYVEAPAVYEIDVIWSQGEPLVSGAELISWTFDGRTQERDTATSLIGNDEVKRQEEAARKAYLDTARRDMADALADSRTWLAAE